MVDDRKQGEPTDEEAREKLKRERVLEALAATAGMLSAEEHPEWATSEKAAAWVRESRRRDDRRLEKAPRG